MPAKVKEHLLGLFAVICLAGLVAMLVTGCTVTECRGLIKERQMVARCSWCSGQAC